MAPGVSRAVLRCGFRGARRGVLGDRSPFTAGAGRGSQTFFVMGCHDIAGGPSYRSRERWTLRVRALSSSGWAGTGGDQPAPACPCSRPRVDRAGRAGEAGKSFTGSAGGRLTGSAGGRLAGSAGGPCRGVRSCELGAWAGRRRVLRPGRDTASTCGSSALWHTATEGGRALGGRALPLRVPGVAFGAEAGGWVGWRSGWRSGLVVAPVMPHTRTARMTLCFGVFVVVGPGGRSSGGSTRYGGLGVTRKWRNGRRARFRSVCPKGRGGSTPPLRTLG